MPLDWARLQREFGDGGDIPTVAGGKRLTITAVDDEFVHIKHPLWRDRLAREHLAKAVDLVEADRMTRHSGLFAEEYRSLVADVRATSVAHVLKHLGVLE
ncbi:hypothetical protein [Actinomycetospora corticicola]|uniref:Uncharacterized protein n=1 Tax=Actinomycetospora corticicola TaxID=663602 RepID=A0A7Y9DXL2_9PSEU|nr:hypothetical protein [Actinomycetospora corticicola]